MKNVNENEARKLAVDAAGDYVKAKGVTSGLTSKQQAGAMVHYLRELGALDSGYEGDSDEAKGKRLELWYGLLALSNCSALRQTLEKAGVLGAPTAIMAEYVD